MKVYRYFSAEVALKTLRSKGLRASNPSKFNDPFEVSPNFNQSEYNIDFVKRLLQQDHIIKEEWNRLDPNIYPNFKKFREYYIQNIDPKAEEKLPEVLGNIQNNKKYFLKLFAEKWRLLCFSRVINSILLWSHYADSHRGVALEFDTSDKYISRLGEEYILKVYYSKSKPDFKPWRNEEEFFREVRKATMWKSRVWKYEKEVRILLSIDELNSDILPFVNQPVRGVYLGINSSDKTLNKTAEILSDSEYKKTTLYKLYADENYYRINIRKIDI